MERFELNTAIGRPIEKIFAVMSNLENVLAVNIDSIRWQKQANSNREMC